ncbi:MAG: hypothetical protein JNL01_04895 [Bdellovibrionales bacterium]|nr:hypothetical protein [Bdellovibrionales bacterium]
MKTLFFALMMMVSSVAFAQATGEKNDSDCTSVTDATSTSTSTSSTTTGASGTSSGGTTTTIQGN